jgi:hypothetical protein
VNLPAEAALVRTEWHPLEDSVVRPTWVHFPPESRCTTTGRLVQAGRPYPDRVNASLVSAEDGADKVYLVAA